MPATIALISRSSETAIDQRQPDGSSAARRAGIISVSPSAVLVARDGQSIRPASGGAVKRLRRGETPPPSNSCVNLWTHPPEARSDEPAVRAAYRGSPVADRDRPLSRRRADGGRGPWCVRALAPCLR